MKTSPYSTAKPGLARDQKFQMSRLELGLHREMNTRMVCVDQRESKESSRKTTSRTFPKESSGGFTEESHMNINMEGSSH